MAVTGQYVADLEQAVRQLAYAVQQHRADMHHPSGRPCETCSFSAKVLRALGVVPFVEGEGQNRTAAIHAATLAAVPRRSDASSEASQ